ncbi:hypothetical protein DFH09DRAFT_1330941 [Mycena vulgaris]|nr:hypothetical protein DFH09DRAFT_1330941 [Mycena vulgaris]
MASFPFEHSPALPSSAVDVADDLRLETGADDCDLRRKSRMLNRLKHDSYDFQHRQREITQIGAEQTRILALTFPTCPKNPIINLHMTWA